MRRLLKISNYRRKDQQVKGRDCDISLHFSCRSPTSSLPLVMHLANGQTMPVLPGPPVQMPSVISVSFVDGAAKPTSALIHPFHLNDHNQGTPHPPPGNVDLDCFSCIGSLPKLFTNLCQPSTVKH